MWTPFRIARERIKERKKESMRKFAINRKIRKKKSYKRYKRGNSEQEKREIMGEI